MYPCTCICLHKTLVQLNGDDRNVGSVYLFECLSVTIESTKARVVCQSKLFTHSSHHMKGKLEWSGFSPEHEELSGAGQKIKEILWLYCILFTTSKEYAEQ